MTIKELREKRAKLVAEARERLDQVNANTDEARASELEAAHDAAMDEYDRVSKLIEREEKQAEIEGRAEEAEQRAREERRPGWAAQADPNGGDGMTYRQAFHQMLRSKLPDAEPLSAEARAVLNKGYRDVEHRAQTTTNAAGGYLVPTELMNEIIVTMQQYGPMYNGDFVREIITEGGNRVDIPTVDDTGSTLSTTNEGVTLPDTGAKDVTLGIKALDAYEYNTEWLRMSKALLDDSPFAVEAFIADLLGERMGRHANLKLTTGTGTGEPNGVVTASSAGFTSASGTAIAADEIKDLYHAVDPAYRQSPRVRFMMNDQTLNAIRKLKDGNNNYIWDMGDMRNGVPGTLLGVPVVINQAMADIAINAKAMLFGDFGKYFVRKVGTPIVGAIQDKDFWPGIGTAGYLRFDGELVDTTAVKHILQAAA